MEMTNSVSFGSTEKSKQEDIYQDLKLSSARELFLPRTGVRRMTGLAFPLKLANTLYLTVTILVILLFITLFVLP